MDSSPASLREVCPPVLRGEARLRTQALPPAGLVGTDSPSLSVYRRQKVKADQNTVDRKTPYIHMGAAGSERPGRGAPGGLTGARSMGVRHPSAIQHHCLCRQDSPRQCPGPITPTCDRIVFHSKKGLSRSEGSGTQKRESARNWAGGLHPVAGARAAKDPPRLQVEEESAPRHEKGLGWPRAEEEGGLHGLLWEGTFPPSLYLLNSCLAFNTRSVFASSLTDTVPSDDPIHHSKDTHCYTSLKKQRKAYTLPRVLRKTWHSRYFRAFSPTEARRMRLGLTATSERAPSRPESDRPPLSRSPLGLHLAPKHGNKR